MDTVTLSENWETRRRTERGGGAVNGEGVSRSADTKEDFWVKETCADVCNATDA